jgi:hypothetical protein
MHIHMQYINACGVNVASCHTPASLPYRLIRRWIAYLNKSTERHSVHTPCQTPDDVNLRRNVRDCDVDGCHGAAI